MGIEIIEIFLIITIVVIQTIVFWKTFLRVQLLRESVPDSDFFKLSRIIVPNKDLEVLPPVTILLRLAKYKKTTFQDDEDSSHIHVIENSSENPVADKIFFSLNNYLIRNRSNAPDFNIMKDIVERNTDTLDESINLTVAVPLYLGLLGTMLGVVIGLFSIPDLSIIIDSSQNDIALNEGISSLIGGVKIAMIASFIGLLLTILNSGWLYKQAKALSESRKNSLYTFIQIELLPTSNHGLGSTLTGLQTNLFKFNDEFRTNLRKLSGIFELNTKTILAQKELLDSIDKAKVSEMAKYNVRVLQQLEDTAPKLEAFNQYITNVKQLVDNTESIVQQSNDFLSRTDDFKLIANNINDNVQKNELLFEFLSAHIKNLESYKKTVSDSVAEVGHSINDVFIELKNHIQDSGEAVKKFTIDELDILQKALSESKTNLSNLEHLLTISNDVSLMKSSTAIQLEKIKSEIGNNIKTLDNVHNQIEAVNNSINSRGLINRMGKVYKHLTQRNV